MRRLRIEEYEVEKQHYDRRLLESTDIAIKLKKLQMTESILSGKSRE